MKVPERCINEDYPEEHSEFSVTELLDSILRKEGVRQRIPSGNFSPSSMAGCKRKLWYYRMKYELRESIQPKERMLFDIGHAIHDMTQSKFKDNVEGFECEDRTKDSIFQLSGYTDGVFRVEDWVLEIKTIGDASFGKLVKPKKEHLWQAYCYMWCWDIPRAQILYINRNNGLRRAFRVWFQNEVWDEIVEVIHEVNGYVEREEAPPPEPNMFNCRTCGFYYICQPNK